MADPPASGAGVTARRPRAAAVAVWALFFLALFPGIAGRDLWNPDEPRYAQVAREMVQSGDYLIPHLNGEIYSHKPPVMFWAIALVGHLRGAVDAVAARLPSALAALAASLLVFGLGRRLFGRRAAWLATAAFGCSAQVLWQARVGQIDMLLTFWVTLAVYCWLRGFESGRRGWYRWFFVVCGVATLTKGPVGLLIPLFGILLFLWVSGERPEIRRLGLGVGVLLWAGVGLLWMVPAALRAGPEYCRQLLFEQILVRFLGSADYAPVRGHLQPWYYYLQVLPASFFPWSLWLPGALLAAWRDRDEDRWRGALFALCWGMSGLLFFSLSPSKRTVYLLVLLPAWALLVGWGLDRAARAWERSRAWFWLPALVPLALGLVVAGIPFLAAGPATTGASRALEGLPEAALAALPWAAAALILGGYWTVIAAWRGRLVSAAAGWAVAMAATFSILTGGVLPHLDVVKSRRPVAQALERLAAPGETYVTPRFEPQFHLYAGRPATVADDGEALRRLHETRPRLWLAGDQARLQALELPPLSLYAQAPLERGAFVLLGPPRADLPLFTATED